MRHVGGRHRHTDSGSPSGPTGDVALRGPPEKGPRRRRHFRSQDALAGYLADAALAPHAHGTERAALVAAELDEPVADFVRLTLTARRPALKG